MGLVVVGSVLMIKLACWRLIWMLLMVVPLRLRRSISCPAGGGLAPVLTMGFLKVQPAEGSGWVLVFFLMMFLAVFWAFLPSPCLRLMVVERIIR